MENNSIADWLKGAFEAAFPGNDFSQVAALPATDPKFGDFQCNDALKFAKDIDLLVLEEIQEKDLLENYI